MKKWRHYNRVGVGRGIKAIDECPKCGKPGYLDAQWSARENTMTWCGPYFQVMHTDDEGNNSPRHYIGIGLRDTYPELKKTPPSIEWMQQFRISKGYVDKQSYQNNEKNTRYLKSLRAQIREPLMNMMAEQLEEILEYIKSYNGEKRTVVSKGLRIDSK